VEFDAEGDKEDADREANQQPQPKDDLNDDRRHHGPEGKKVFHEIFLSWYYPALKSFEFRVSSFKAEDTDNRQLIIPFSVIGFRLKRPGLSAN
jgi:hypothetical protein